MKKTVSRGALLIALILFTASIPFNLTQADESSLPQRSDIDDKYKWRLEDIYANLDRVHEVNVRGAKTLGAKLEMHRDDAMLARKLTGIACDAPIEEAETAMQPSAPKLGEINALYDEAGIGMALRRQAERISDIYRH